MIFTAGELVILAVVAIALVVFRQLDRGNRSLEKVRKYAEKAREDLAGFVEERAAGIKDYSIELDVQQKAAKVLLERIQALEASLNGRADAIARIDARIAEYDKAMHELEGMTLRAQENLDRLHEESRFVDTAARKVREAQEALVRVQDDLSGALLRSRQESESALAAHKDRLLAESEERLQAVDAELAKTEERIRQYENFAVEVEKRRERSVAAAMEKLDAEFEGAFARARAEADKLEGAAFKKLKEGISERAQRLQEALEDKYQALQCAAKEKIAETQGMLKSFRADWQREAAGLFEGARAEAASITAAVQDRLDALERAAAAFEAAHEDRLGGLEAASAERLARVEAKAEALAKGTADKLGRQIEAYQARAQAGLDEARGAQQAIDAKLSSHELEVVGGIEARLDAYRKEVDYRFKTLDSVNVDIEQLEGALRRSMLAIEDKLKGEFEDFSGTLFERQREGERRLDGDMAKLQTSLDEIEGELAALKARAYDNVSEKLKVFEDDFFADIQKRSAAINEALDSFRADVEKRYGDQLAKRLAEHGAKANAQLERIGEQVAALKVGSMEAMKQIAADFAAQKKALIEQNQEERKALRQELADNARRVDELSGAVTVKAKEALAEFARDYESVAQDARRQASEISLGSAASLKAFKDEASGVRERFESQLARAEAKAEEGLRALGTEMAEIDKRQKAYLAQTKLFERGDELKDQLASDIEGLKAQIAAIADKRREVEALDSELAKVRRMEEETAAKVKDFLQEKRRIDKMEEDFNRLLALSQSIEGRLTQLSGSDDALEKAQLDMRRFLELSGEVEAKYERFEKKGAVIEATAAAVEKNFQGLQALEKGVKELGGELKAIPKAVNELRKDVDALHERKEQVALAVEKLAGLDGTLADIEKRSESMQKAREWLAKTETRLEEIARQAQDQVKLLEGLLKAEGKSGKGDKGAPPLSVREMVTKLARQGWSVEEIARATKLSRGEVELILEVGAK